MCMLLEASPCDIIQVVNYISFLYTLGSCSTMPLKTLWIKDVNASMLLRLGVMHSTVCTFLGADMAGLVLKESRDIANLLKAIPHREQRGLFSSDVCWTCVDFTTDWVAVGTDSGWLYLYDRFEETVKHRLTTQPVWRLFLNVFHSFRIFL